MQDDKINNTAANADGADSNISADETTAAEQTAQSNIEEAKEIVSDADKSAESAEVIVSDANEDSSDVIVSDASEVSDAEPEEEFHYVPKLSEKQQKIWQTVMGLVAGAAVWFSLGLSTAFQDNGFLRWLFLLVFVVVMVVRAQIEKRTGVILRTFMKFFLIGLIVFLGVFVIYGLVSGKFTTPAA